VSELPKGLVWPSRQLILRSHSVPVHAQWVRRYYHEVLSSEWGCVAVFSPESPIGGRCTRNGADVTWGRNTWNRSISDYRDEMAKLYRNELDPSLSDSEHADYFAQLRDLDELAAQGILTFAGKQPPVKVMESVHWVLELRPTLDDEGEAFSEPPRLLRMYFAEPREEPDMLLALHLATKANGADVNREQTASVRESARRADSWAGAQAAARYDRKQEA